MNLSSPDDMECSSKLSDCVAGDNADEEPVTFF